MIHVLNYSENIIDDLSFKQDAIYDANHTINIQDTMETFDFEVSSKIAQNLRDRHRLLIQDHMGIYREFIIESIVDLESGVTEVQSNASYLEDIRTAKPVKPHSFKDQPPTVMMDYLLADTGWEVSPETEVPMNADFSWDKVTDRLELLKELQDVFNMRLLFYVEVGKNNVEKRYVKLVEVNPIFNGEEIDYKENLIGLKREIDYSEVVTALLGVGPEDSETKKRIYVEVTDDKAQEQFGLPQRYIWDYYEVQVDSETKVTSELIRKETLKELERRKQAVVTYDISSTDIDAQVGDMIRVKDEDFNPEIYLEAEIVEIHYNLLNNVKEYKFGILKEFTREQVYSQYDKFRKELEERLKEIISNTDSIISERLEEELKYVERYIEKSPTPPLAPKEGDLWLDTTDPKVAILKRYENGKWVKSSVDHVSQIGGLTREETMYETLKERLHRIENSYFEAFKRHDALVTERHYHYVKDAIKNNLNIKLNGLKNSYDDFKIAFNNINSEQPTVGLITAAISRAVEFEAKLKEYNDSYYVARKEFDEVIAILQSQYSDEKFNEAMTEVAEAIGGTFDGTKIIADVPNKQELEDLNTSIKQYLNGEITALDGKLGKQIETTVNQAKNEFNVAIESVEKKVDGIEIGGRNLVLKSDVKKTSSNYAVATYSLSMDWDLGQTYTVTIKGDINSGQAFGIWANGSATRVTVLKYDSDLDLYISTFTPTSISTQTAKQLRVCNYLSSGAEFAEIEWIKLEKGNKATDWTPAPEDMENKVSNISQTVTKNSSSIGVLENQIALKVNSSEVTQRLNEALKPVKSDIQTNSAELLVQKGLIEQRVTKTDYTTDMNGVVKRLSTSEGKISTLEKEIKLKVSETDVQNKIDELQIGGRNLLKNSNDLIENTTYNIARYYFDEDIKEGEQVTVSLKGQLGSDRTAFTLYNSGGYVFLVSLYPNNQKDGIYTATFNWKIKRENTTAQNKWVNVYQVDSSGTTASKIEWIKLEKGKKATDWTPAPEDMEDRVKKAEGSITVNSDAISQKVSYTEINKTNKTLERVISELIVDARGISYQYDVNGMIQGFTLNKDYFKLNHNLIDINNGDVIITNGKTTIKDAFINNLAGNTAFINSLTSKSAFINNAKVTELISANGRDTFTLAGGQMNWTRSDGLNMEMGINGIYMKNANGSIRFQMDTSMVTSAALGTSNSNVYLATDTGFEARVVDRNQLPGSGAINDYTYRPMRALIYRFPDVPNAYFTLYNGGEFRFTGETTGAGAVYQDVRANVFHGAGFRTTSTNLYLGTDNLVHVVNKGFVDGSTDSPIYRDIRVKTAYVTDTTATGANYFIRSDDTVRLVAKGSTDIYRDLVSSGVYTDFVQINPNTGSNNMYVRASGEVRFTANNSTTSYTDVRARGIYGTFIETTATNMYVRASGEVRFTDKGTTNSYKPIRFSEWTATSHEKYKHDIEEWNYNVLDIFKFDLKLHRYKFNSDLNTEYDRYRHGIIIRYDSNKETFPIEWRNGDGFDGNEVMWWNTKAIQELAYENDELKSEIEELNNKINKIMEMIE